MAPVLGNGLCTIDIVKKGTAEFDMSSGPELSRAMWKLINQCVRDEGGQGGVASNIGMLIHSTSLSSSALVSTLYFYKTVVLWRKRASEQAHALNR